MSHIFKKKSFKKTSFGIVFNAGSCFEKEGQKGTMHLMEHLICKTFKDMLDLFTVNGIEFNAFTDTDHIVVYCKGLSSRLTSDIKHKFTQKILGGLDCIDEEAFETEKLTVIQEYLDNFQDIGGKLLNLLRTKFGNYNAIGLLDDIKAFTYEDMKATYKEMFTHPARIIEVGPTQTDLSDLKIEYQEEPLRPVNRIKYKKDWKLPQEETPDTNKATVVVLGKKIISKADYPYMNIACAMLSAGLNSPLYKAIREDEGLSYFSHAEVESVWKDSIWNFAATTTPENEQRLIDIYKKVLANVKGYLTEQRFNDIMSLAAVEKEEKNLLRYAHVGDLINKGLPQMPDNLKKFTYEKLVEVVSKYVNEQNAEIITLR